MNLQSFFDPQSIAVIGASENPKKLGSMILQNIIDSGFKKTLYAVNPKFENQTKNNIKYLNSIKNAPPLDLVIIVIPSNFILPVIEEAIANKTKNLIIISAGFREVGNQELEDQIVKKCQKHKINILGPNCLGAIFPLKNINASFSDGYPQKGNIAFISQSGAFCTAMLDWAKSKNIGFSHFISLGNKSDISEIEILQSLANDPQVKIFALYLESLKDGKAFLDLIRNITPKKPVIILEPGISKASSQAAASHTGSLAPNSEILKTAYKEAGAIQVFSMRNLFGTIQMLEYQSTKNLGNRIAVITNAGGVGVLSTDLSEEAHLKMADFSANTKKSLRDKFQTDHNPLDVIGDAPSSRYKEALEIVIKDPQVDQILVLLTPQSTTEVEKTAQIIAEVNKKTDKNIITSFIGGEKVSPGIKILEENRVPHFNFPVDATRVLGPLALRSHNKKEIKRKTVSKKEIKKIIEEDKKRKLKSLSAENLNKIITQYKIPVPKVLNTLCYEEALKFSQNNFPVVLKIVSPQTLHKTEIKGVITDIKNTQDLKNAWNQMTKNIQKFNIPYAQIQVQEQIKTGTEVILGFKRDPHMGEIIVFGWGGIYAEVINDTTLKILPTQDFESMIKNTKVGKILYGTRGEKPKDIKNLIKVMKQFSEIFMSYPEIESIDLNPIIVGEKSVSCVDIKIIL